MLLTTQLPCSTQNRSTTTHQVEDFDAVESKPCDAVLNVGLDDGYNVQEHGVVDLPKISAQFVRDIFMQISSLKNSNHLQAHYMYFLDDDIESLRIV